mgnify:CR=1 FL=1
MAATLPVLAGADRNNERANELELKLVHCVEEDELVLPFDCKRTDRENSVVLRFRSILFPLARFSKKGPQHRQMQEGGSYCGLEEDEAEDVVEEGSSEGGGSDGEAATDGENNYRLSDDENDNSHNSNSAGNYLVNTNSSDDEEHGHHKEPLKGAITGSKKRKDDDIYSIVGEDEGGIAKKEEDALEDGVGHYYSLFADLSSSESANERLKGDKGKEKASNPATEKKTTVDMGDDAYVVLFEDAALKASNEAKQKPKEKNKEKVTKKKKKKTSKKTKKTKVSKDKERQGPLRLTPSEQSTLDNGNLILLVNLKLISPPQYLSNEGCWAITRLYLE